MRKLLLVLFAILFGFSVLLLFIPTLFQDQIANALRKEINENLHAEVTFSAAHISLWRDFPQFSASLDEFALIGKDEFLGDTLVHARNVNLVLSSRKLLFGDEIEIRHLALVRPGIYVSVQHNGHSNVEILRSDPSDTVNDVTLNVESWEIEEGTLIYEDRHRDIHVSAAKVALNGVIGVRGSVTGVSVAGVMGRVDVIHSEVNYMEDKNVSFLLEGSYDSHNRELKFSENSISINNLDLTFSGMLGFRGDDTGIDLKIKTGEAEFKDILSLSKVMSRDFDKMNIGGRMSLDAQFLGVYNDQKDKFPSFKANLIVNDGSIRYNARQSSLSEINFDLAAFNKDGHLESTTVSLQYFGMNLGENPIYGSAQIEGFRDGRISADVLARFPLQDLAAIYPMEGIELSGDLDFELKANGSYTGKLSDLSRWKNWRNSRIPAFQLGVGLSGGNIRYSNLPDTISNVNLQLFAVNRTGDIEDISINIPTLEGILGENPIEGHLAFEGLSEPVVSGAIKAGLNLEEVKNFYPLEQLTLKGLVDIDINVDGRWSQEARLFPKVHASVNVRNGYLKSDEYPAPVEKAHLVLQAVNETGRFADTRFIIDTLTYSIEGEPFVIRGSVEDLERYHYDVDVAGVLYLEKLHKIFSLDGAVMGGEVDIDLRASGNLADLKARRYHLLPTEGQMKIRDVFIKNRVIPHGLRMDGHLFFTNEKIFLDTLHGSLGDSKFHLTGHFYNYLAYVFHRNEPIKGDLVFESPSFDINEIWRDGAPSQDTTHHDLLARTLPANVDFTFDSKVSELFYKNLSLHDLEGEITLRNGVLTLNKTRFESLGAIFSVSGDYDPRDARHPQFALDLSIHDLDINKAHAAFVAVQAIAPAAEDTYGVFSVDYRLEGELTANMFPVFESLKGEGTVRIRDAMVNGMKLFHHISGLTKKEELMNPKLKDIVMDIDVSDGVANVKPFTMKLAGFDTEITGKHELRGNMNYLLRIALPPFDLVKIPLHVDGTYDNPKVHIGKGHEDDLRRAIGHGTGTQGML